MNFSEKLKTWQDQVNRALDQALPGSEVHPARLHQAIRHSVDAGGKRLRPILVLAAEDLFRGENDPMSAALAIELIHTYSLIHDDLPAMDDSDLRRGKPSCHIAFDEATAILAGDALQPMAFEWLARGYASVPKLFADLTLILAETAGSQQLVGGQMQDLLSEGKEPDEKNLSYIHENKTAAMIRASLEMGFRIGAMGEDEAKTARIREAGLSLGLAFQAVDDLLDVTGSTEELGKDAHHDLEQGKVTWVTLKGEDGARALAREHTERAREGLRELGGESGFLLELTTFMLERKH
ncbi:MAG: polyprenyl synthetase [Verrucomicrobia bacterium TMED40]|nr:MAG: polyprenyl synthetase [Verrucomicrobia bacterium TMED40]|tara:strand:- start:479 stop:1363 length:885 start_codon:yes stop_codon:yes gene_type:complete